MLKISQVYYEHPSPIDISHNFGLLFINCGEGRLTSGDHQVMPVVLHRVYLINQTIKLSIVEGSVTGYLLQFSKTVLDHFMVESITQRSTGIFNQKTPLPYVDILESDVYFLKDLLAQLMAELERNSPFTAVEQYCFMLFKHINRDALAIRETPLHADNAIMIAQLIDQYFLTERKSKFYADKMGISAKELNRLTRALYNKRFGEVLLARVCYEGDIRLANVKMPIKVIAWELGYEEYGHFNTMYKRCKGYSAAEFRNRIIKQNKN